MLRFGVRTLAKTPGFTVVAILVLAIGIGANTAMFSLVNALLLKPLAGQADELVGLYSHDRTKSGSYRAFSYWNYADMQRRQRRLRFAHGDTPSAMVGVPAGDSTRQTFIEVVSSNYFDTLGVSLEAGRTFTLDEERPGARVPVAVVSHKNRDLLGKTVKINSIDFTVVGVAPPNFTGTMALLSPEMWLPLGMFDVVVNDIFKNNGLPFADRRNQTLVVAGRLKPGDHGRECRAASRRAFASAREGLPGREQRPAVDGESAAAARDEHVAVVRLGRRSWAAC